MSPIKDSAVSGFNPSGLIGELVDQTGVKDGAKLVLAYSGGVDSELLALGLSEFAREHCEYRYLLVHVHHGLSDNADVWVRHCESRANVYGLPISIKRVVVDTGPRKSIEAEARNVRYDAIQSQMEPGDVLLTGHHLDDQLETVLLALKRGLGPKGLSAMGSTQVFDGNKQLIRPLLSISRELIEAKASALGLIHITDESNSDAQYDRNFLRLEIIPRLKARWGAIATTASRSAFLCAQQQAVIDDEVSERLPAFISSRKEGGPLDLGLLAAQSVHWQSLLFRGFIEKLGFAPLSQIQLVQALSQLLTARRDAKVELRLGDLLIRRYQGLAFLSSLIDEKNESPIQTCIEVDSSSLLDKDAEVSLSLSKRNRLSIIKVSLSDRVRLPDRSQLVSIRFSVKGSTRCHPVNRDKARELKKLWQEYGIPPWERERVPCIFYGEQLVCAVGYWIETGFLCEQEERGLVFNSHQV
ncbi:tRNA lysidine(34) synthetase TilS [Shewanella sp. YLB-07]|uniref:tRNA lysidine(34) synthetase TilS n=1 Tax=Shewanella sp. YLB-07 TaxID=2601268 RepID=UPI00128B02CE|nr:tRNA lysidine(34) synthetase TilS [Shewanella sp. YLB-07]MPY21229.1 tRNA lysidine(34) synthetase TilS [Shewanella sp. YLB-07]MPY22016.1 tRNA lysidine(34) synthetase TilS [Shewanella sp. YLB-07]